MQLVIPKTNGVALAKAMMAMDFYCAWGSGDAAWEATPVVPSEDAVALVAELGRRKVSLQQYLVLDQDDGTITLGTANYSVSVTPTNLLYLKTIFGVGDSSAAIVREFGIFSGVVLDTGLPVEQAYFPPSDVAELGLLMSVENVAAITRNGATAETHEVLFLL